MTAPRPPTPTRAPDGLGALATLRETVRSFSRHGGTLLGGAMAFFALLSAVPTFVIALDVAGAVTSRQSARDELLRGFRAWMGRDGAHTIGLLLDQVQARAAGPWQRALGALVVVYGSTRLFTQTQRALNLMWDVTARPTKDLRVGALRVLQKRAVAFAMVVVCALFLLASTLLRAAAVSATEVLPLPVHWILYDHAVSFAVTALLFTAIFKWLPDVRIVWRDALAGGVLTAALFALGKVLIARYLARESHLSVFGVAGSVVVLLLWVHYSAQIFFFGAAFTAVRARRAGRPLEPTANALRVSIEG